MKKTRNIVLPLFCVILFFTTFSGKIFAQKNPKGKQANKPLFRDPVFDGAADPAVIWNRKEKKWFMFYTNRRANAPGQNGVSWVHGTRIGIAESADGCFLEISRHL